MKQKYCRKNVVAHVSGIFVRKLRKHTEQKDVKRNDRKGRRYLAASCAFQPRPRNERKGQFLRTMGTPNFLFYTFVLRLVRVLPDCIERRRFINNVHKEALKRLVAITEELSPVQRIGSEI
jgi:hypothetical protein